MDYGHDHGHDHGDHQQMSLTPKKVSKVKAFDADSSFSIEGMDNGSFAIASNKKELKQLMKSDADVVYYEKKGKLYLNENGEEKGWGKEGWWPDRQVQKQARTQC